MFVDADARQAGAILRAMADAAEHPVDELREEYAVPHLDPRLAAEDTPPAWYHPSP